MAAIWDWLAPTKVMELRSFLRLANYYKQFIAVYSKITLLLTELLKKEKEWRWELECRLPSKGSKMLLP